ncbi:MAG TPA: hypothetical protein VLM11_19185 [Streptosporangiaceae bacterium]|nr:hypothetical protein [Streptosporangiaceae bacterium]
MVRGRALLRKELHEAAEELDVNQAALIAAGEPTIEKGLDKAFTGAAKLVKRPVEATPDEITSKWQQALKKAIVMNMNLEVDIIPVSDVERSRQFYQKVGWRYDDDTAVGDDVRIVQFTPPPTSSHAGRQSPCCFAPLPHAGRADWS